jgi:translation initiation factor 4G
MLHRFFECLYDNDLISEEALLAWERCDDAADSEGKGVAIKSAKAFFDWLRQAEPEPEPEAKAEA